MWGRLHQHRVMFTAIELVKFIVRYHNFDNPLTWGKAREMVAKVEPLPAHYQMRDFRGKVVFDSKKPPQHAIKRTRR